MTERQRERFSQFVITFIHEKKIKRQTISPTNEKIDLDMLLTFIQPFNIDIIISRNKKFVIEGLLAFSWFNFFVIKISIWNDIDGKASMCWLFANVKNYMISFQSQHFIFLMRLDFKISWKGKNFKAYNNEQKVLCYYWSNQILRLWCAHKL